MTHDHADLVARLRIPTNFGSPHLEKQAADAIEAQAAEIAVLRADAQRYRWLRDKAQGEIVFDDTASLAEGHHFLLRVPFDGRPIHNDAEAAERLDSAIDAARNTLESKT